MGLIQRRWKKEARSRGGRAAFAENGREGRREEGQREEEQEERE